MKSLLETINESLLESKGSDKQNALSTKLIDAIQKLKNNISFKGADDKSIPELEKAVTDIIGKFNKELGDDFKTFYPTDSKNWPKQIKWYTENY